MYSLLCRELVVGQSKTYEENKRGGGIKRSVRTYLRREDCGSCERWVGAEINVWIQNGKHNMLFTQLREIQERRSLLVLNTIKKIFFVAKQMRTENQDVNGEKWTRGDDDNLSLDDPSKKPSWKQSYERLLNIEFL